MALENPGDIPDIYCDAVQVGMTPFDVMLWLMRRPPAYPQGLQPQSAKNQEVQVNPVAVGTVRMSLEQAKAFAIIVRKNLKAFEDQTGPIPMHPSMLAGLGISKSQDW